MLEKKAKNRKEIINFLPDCTRLARNRRAAEIPDHIFGPANTTLQSIPIYFFLRFNFPMNAYVNLPVAWFVGQSVMIS